MDKTDIKRPVVFVHGAWHGAWCWDKWLAVFRDAGYETIAVELRGHGYKVGTYKHARLENYIQDVETVLNELEGEPILIGHSLGCSVIRHLSQTRRFTATVLVAPVPDAKYFRRVVVRQILRHPYLSLRSVLARSMQPWVSSRRSYKLFFSSHIAKATAKEYVTRMQGESLRLFLLDLVRGWDESDDNPTKLVAAGDDAFISPHIQAEYARQIKADYSVAQDSGHDIMLDVASYAVAKDVLRWLESRSDVAVTE